MRQYSGRILGIITAVIILFLTAGIFVYGLERLNGDVSEDSAITPVLYQEKSVPVEPSGAIPDTDSNDEGMLDMEKGPTVINL